MHLKHVGFVLLLTNICVVTIFPQTFNSPPINYFQFNSDKNINTYRNRGNINLYASTLNFKLNISDEINSTFISAKTPIYRDENLFFLKSVFSENINFKPVVELRSFIVRDNYQTENKNEYNSILGGVEFKPTNNLQTTSMVGYRNDNQQTINDNGFGYFFNAKIDSAEASIFLPASFLQIEKFSLSNRTLSTINGNIIAINKFTENGYDSIQIKYFDQRSDFYVATDSALKNIRSRVDNIISLQNIFNYPLSEKLFLNFKTLVDLRRINNSYKYYNNSQPSLFPTSVRDFKLGGIIQINYFQKDFQLATGIGYSENNEEHFLTDIQSVQDNIFSARQDLEFQLNNFTKKTNIWARFYKSLSASDYLNLNFSSGILHYNTPSNNNFEDRDELTINTSIEEKHIFNSNLILTSVFDFTLLHNVYLLKERSGNNSWNRVLRLGTNILFTPADNFYSVNSFEVLANYTAYDFERVRANIKSYSYRQFRLIDSTIVKINSDFDAIVYLQFREFLRGQLAWDQFSERPEEFVDEIFFTPNIKYSVSSGNLILGLKYFQQIRYRYIEKVKTYNDDFISIGPTFEINWKQNNFDFSIKALREYRFTSGKNAGVVNDFQLSSRYFW
ncbi:MAG: hypothetical protein O3A55_03290 [Bacteroidetes bacterium]|nr:hypothetical protein [Bacteroidota bacterium]